MKDNNKRKKSRLKNINKKNNEYNDNNSEEQECLLNG